MARYVVEPRGPFSLEEARRFLAGLRTGRPRGRVAARAICTSPSCPTAPTSRVAPACAPATGRSRSTRSAPRDPDATRRQVERMLSLDVDARGFAAVAERDPVVGGLRDRHPGWRPVSFASPFEAGTWFLLSQRTRRPQAAAIKLRLRDELGEVVTVDGEERRAFPAPDRIAALEWFAGVPERKWANVRALAHAALEGRLDGERLRCAAARGGGRRSAGAAGRRSVHGAGDRPARGGRAGPVRPRRAPDGEGGGARLRPPGRTVARRARGARRDVAPVPVVGADAAADSAGGRAGSGSGPAASPLGGLDSPRVRRYAGRCKPSSRGGTDSPSRKVRTSQGEVVGTPTRGNPRESATETHRRWRGFTWVSHRQG